MDWALVFTQKQRDRLIDATTKEIDALISWAEKSGFGKEVVVSAIYGCDSLVVKEQKLFEKVCWISRSDNDPNKYTYEPVYENQYLKVIEKYRLTPKDISDTRSRAEKRLAEEQNKAKEREDALEELKKLVQSSTAKDLIREIQIAGSDFGSKLILRRDGLKEITEKDICEVKEANLKEILGKYNLSYRELAAWRSKLEA